MYSIESNHTLLVIVPGESEAYRLGEGIYEDASRALVKSGIINQATSQWRAWWDGFNGIDDWGVYGADREGGGFLDGGMGEQIEFFKDAWTCMGMLIPRRFFDDTEIMMLWFKRISCEELRRDPEEIREEAEMGEIEYGWWAHRLAGVRCKWNNAARRIQRVFRPRFRARCVAARRIQRAFRRSRSVAAA